MMSCLSAFSALMTLPTITRSEFAVAHSILAWLAGCARHGEGQARTETPANNTSKHSGLLMVILCRGKFTCRGRFSPHQSSPVPSDILVRLLLWRQAGLLTTG